MTPRRARIVFAVSLLALALLTWARIAVVDRLHDQGFFAKYYEFADAILAGHPPRDRIGDVSPAYLWLTVLFRALGMGFRAIRDAQIVALSLAALCCALAAKRLGGWTAAIAAALLILGSRAALVTATELEPETVILLLNAAALALIVRHGFANDERGTMNDEQKPARSSFIVHRSSLLLAGLCVGISATARPTALLALVLVVIWLAWRSSRRAAVWFASAALVPLAIVLLVNRVVAGHAIIMQPGTVVYEGNNPLATGCAGVMPRIIGDLNVSTDEPDYLHVAYRIVASRATGQPIDARLSNRFWSGKALAYVSTYPLDALALIGWKAVLAVHHYDVYDLITTKRKADELARWPAIPFGAAFVLALVAIVLRREKRELVLPLLFAAATLVAIVAFTVTTRQRNPLLAPLAILGGVGVAEMVALVRRKQVERALLAFGAVLIAVPLLGIEGPPMREDAYIWWSALRGDATRDAAIAARDRGDKGNAARLAAVASVLKPADPPLVSPPTLRAVALDLAQRTTAPERLFDIAIALQKAGAWREAAAVLRLLPDYEPRRENHAVSSVSYYRARSAIHLAAPSAVVVEMLDEAGRDAPGDPDVLALRTIFGDPRALRTLNELHDPFTRDYALARAYIEVGEEARAAELLAGVRRAMPEWRRPGVRRDQ